MQLAHVTTLRLALATLPPAATPAESVTRAVAAMHDAARAGAKLVAFPECYVPGYRWPGRDHPPPDLAFLAAAHDALVRGAGEAGIVAVVGTERVVGDRVRLTALVATADGRHAGWQDKVQLDPSEDAAYAPGEGRALFAVDDVPFGVVICHEGWRYPETVRWAARRGARLVLHLHHHEPDATSWRPTGYAEPGNSFHEAAVRCRAAENTIWFATVNVAVAGAPSTSAVADPDGTIVAWQPHGVAGVLVHDLDPSRATAALARRCRTVG